MAPAVTQWLSTEVGFVIFVKKSESSWRAAGCASGQAGRLMSFFREYDKIGDQNPGALKFPRVWDSVVPTRLATR